MISIYPVIMVTGPRQVGKTTLLNYMMSKLDKKINYVTLDDIKLRIQANEDPELFLRTHEAPLIIDEFQYAPNLLSYVKMIVDQARMNEMFGDNKEVETLYYLTGLQIFQTMQDVSESLAGRVGIIDLFPLSTREINNSKEDVFIPNIENLKQKEMLSKTSMFNLFERILRGSYPNLYNDSNDEFEKYYETYIRTYMERDIRNIINIKDEHKFYKFISSLAARTA